MGPPPVVLPVVLVSVVVPDAPPALVETVPPAVVADDVVVVATLPLVPVVAAPDVVEPIVVEVPVLVTAAELLPFVLPVVLVLVAVRVPLVDAVGPSIVSWLSAAGSLHPTRTPRLKRAPAAVTGRACWTDVRRLRRKALKRESIVASELRRPFGSTRQCRFQDGSFKKSDERESLRRKPR